MTYLIGDQSISLEGPTLTPQEEQLIKAHPGIFKACLNSTAHQYLLSAKKIVHLYTDIVTIYSTLLLKIPNYEDIRMMASKTRMALVLLESDMNKVFGSEVSVLNEGWETQDYEAQVKKIALVVLQSVSSAFESVYKTLSCIDVFFETFDNLKKLLVPCLLTHTRMIQKLVTGAMCFFRLSTIVNQILLLPVITPVVVKQLQKIDTITCGLERETKLLDMVYGAINPSLQQYTAILLGKAILKREVAEHSCQIVRRREICYQAAEHVVSIPLLGAPASTLYLHQFTRHIFIFFLALLVVVFAVAYRLYNVVFG